MSVLSVYYNNMFFAGAVVLFVIGFLTLLLHRNLIKKTVGLGIMDSSIYLILTSLGYINGKTAPIVADVNEAVTTAVYGNPLPTGLVLTGIVVSVSVTAFMLALIVRLYGMYHTLDLDEILAAAKKGDN